MTYREFQNLFRSSSCHRVSLRDSSGTEYIGVYNGLSYWGRVFAMIDGNEYNGLQEVANLTVNDAGEETFHVRYFEEAGFFYE